MIAEKVLAGLPLEDIFIFDVHGHYGSHAPMLQNDSRGGIVATMDRLGVNAICVSANMAWESDNRLGNQLVAEAAKEYPGRIYGYAVPTPWYADEDFEGWFAPGSGMIGVKVHAPMQKTGISDPGYIPAYELAHKKRLPVLFHAWNAGEINHAAEVAARYKDAKIILGHAGMTDYNAKIAVIDACMKHDNVFLDTAISSTYEGAVEWIVAKVGADRVLCGSDLPFFDCRQTFGKIALSKLTETEKIKIFGENARKIFNL